MLKPKPNFKVGDLVYFYDDIHNFGIVGGIRYDAVSRNYEYLMIYLTGERKRYWYNYWWLKGFKKEK